jgi:hypothetical protein
VIRYHERALVDRSPPLPGEPRAGHRPLDSQGEPSGTRPTFHRAARFFYFPLRPPKREHFPKGSHPDRGWYHRRWIGHQIPSREQPLSHGSFHVGYPENRIDSPATSLSPANGPSSTTRVPASAEPITDRCVEIGWPLRQNSNKFGPLCASEIERGNGWFDSGSVTVEDQQIDSSTAD